MKQGDHMDELFKWFVKNFTEISKDYSGKAVIIKDYAVVDSFDNEFIANRYARDHYTYGNYIIQDVSDDTSCYITTIASAQFFEK